ncbi:hypothetical protein [Lysobacter sp. cf310]|uniref:hypothetical protein n=1 Tax=Lysobacter sp. cf310 TaxID=1761790 RepID=UPI001587CB9B|nr:hypothetical protein [Lysobacter sp. cf310]
MTAQPSCSNQTAQRYRQSAQPSPQSAIAIAIAIAIAVAVAVAVAVAAALKSKSTALTQTTVDPKGGAQDARRFSIGQGCPIEKSRRTHRTRKGGLVTPALLFGYF